MGSHLKNDNDDYEMSSDEELKHPYINPIGVGELVPKFPSYDENVAEIDHPLHHFNYKDFQRRLRFKN